MSRTQVNSFKKPFGAAVGWICLTLLVASPVIGQDAAETSSAPAKTDAAKPEAKAKPKFGPPYKVLPIHEELLKPTVERRARMDVLGIVRGGKPLGEPQNRRLFEIYVTQYVFAKMTQTDELSTLPEQRQNFFKNYVWRASDEVHDRVIELAARYMGEIVKDNYHPAVRVNAMLLLGSLNSEELSGFGSSQTPPKPYLPALGMMFRELDNPDQIDAVRVAALVGIRRHAQLDAALVQQNEGQLTQSMTRLLIDRMMEIVRMDEPPAGRSADGHEWMKRQAVDILAYLGTIASGGSVADTLDEIVADDSASLHLRCTAAKAIGRLKYTEQQNFDAAEASGELAEMAALACRQELDWWETEAKREELREAEKKSQTNRGQGYGAGAGAEYGSGGAEEMGMGEFGGDYGLFGSGSGGAVEEVKVEEDYRLTRTRRRLRYNIWCVKQGLAGDETTGGGLLSRTSAPEQQKPIQTVLEKVNELMELTDEVAVDREDLLKKVRVAYQELLALVPENPAEELGAPGVAPAQGDTPDQSPADVPLDAPPVDRPPA